MAMAAPVTEAATVLERVAAGDLRTRMQGDHRGDFGTVKQAINTAVENLDTSLVQVATSAMRVATASHQINRGSQTLSHGSSTQASTLQEISSSLQEMASMSVQNAANAQASATCAGTAPPATESERPSRRRSPSSSEPNRSMAVWSSRRRETKTL